MIFKVQGLCFAWFICYNTARAIHGDKVGDGIQHLLKQQGYGVELFLHTASF